MSRRNPPRGRGWLRAAAILVASVAVAIGVASPARAELPHGLDQVTNVEEASKLLLDLENAGKISHDDMMRYAAELEPRLRGRLLNDWGVADSGKNLLGVERTGSNPAAGKGVLGDEDLQTKTLQQWNDLRRQAEDARLTIEVDPAQPYRYRIKELNAIVWKPNGDTYEQILRAAASDPQLRVKVPPGVEVPGVTLDKFRRLPTSLDPAEREKILRDLSRRGELFEVISGNERISPVRPTPADGIATRRDAAWTAAGDDEVALLARPGTKMGPSDAAEANLENMGKGMKHLLREIGPEPTGADKMALVEASKDVLRSMQAAGLCEKQRPLCDQLARAKRMDGPVLEELGFGNAQQTQQRLIDLQREAFERSQQIFRNEVEKLRGWLTDPEKAADPYLANRLEQLRAQAERMSIRFEQIERMHPGAAKILGGSASEFWTEQMTALRELGEQANAARQAASNGSNARRVTVVINTMQLVECLQRRSAPRASGAYLPNAPSASAMALCLGEFLVGEALSRVIAKGTEVLFTTPLGARIALGAISGVAGVVILVNLIQIYEAGVEVWSYFVALQEEGAAEAVAQETAERVEARHQEEVAKFAADLAAFRREVEQARQQMTDDASQQRTELESLAERIGKLMKMGEQSEALLATLRREASADGAACERSGAGTPRAATAAVEAEALADRAEHALRDGLSAATSCAGDADLGRAKGLLAQAEQALVRLELLGAGAGPASQQKGGPDEARERLARAKHALEQIEADLREATEATDRFKTLRDEVKETRISAEERIRGLRGRYDFFVYRFPEKLLELERANGNQVASLGQAIDALSSLPLSDAFVEGLDQRRFELEMVVIPNVRDRRLEIERGIGTAERCLAATAPDSPERLDTALTIGRLADATMGRDLRGRVEACATRIAAQPPGRGGSQGGAAGQPDPAALARDLAACEASLACLEEGARKYPKASLDCNGSYTMQTREREIEAARKRCASLRAAAGVSEPTTTAHTPGPRTFDADALTRDLARWERQITCLERAKSDPNAWTGDCNTFLMGTPDEQIAILRRQIADGRRLLGQPTAEAPEPPRRVQRDERPAEEDRKPWERGDVQRMTDEWLSRAVAGVTSDGREVRYNEWAQPLAQGMTSTGKPDHPADWSRHRYLWETRARWTSTNLCSLGEYLERRMDGGGADGCAKAAPAQAAAQPPAPQPPAAPAPAPSRGWQAPMPVTGETTRAEARPPNGGRGWSAPMEVTGGTTQRRESPYSHPDEAGTPTVRTARSASPPPAAMAPAPSAPSKATSDPFVGGWSCSLDAQDGGYLSGSGLDHFALSIRRSGSGYEAEANGDRVFGSLAGPGRLHLEDSGSNNGATYTTGLDLQLADSRLYGTGTLVSRDPDGEGHSMPYSMDCSR